MLHGWPHNMPALSQHIFLAKQRNTA